MFFGNQYPDRWLYTTLYNYINVQCLGDWVKESCSGYNCIVGERSQMHRKMKNGSGYWNSPDKWCCEHRKHRSLRMIGID